MPNDDLTTRYFKEDRYGETALDRIKDHADNGTMPRQFRADLHDLLAANAALVERVKGLEGALRPFATAYGTVASLENNDPRWPDQSTLDCDDNCGFAEFLTIADLRAARAALNPGDAS